MPTLSFRQREINRLTALRQNYVDLQGVSSSVIFNLTNFQYQDTTVPANLYLGVGQADQPLREAFRRFLLNWVENRQGAPAKIAELDILIADVTDPANGGTDPVDPPILP